MNDLGGAITIRSRLGAQKKFVERNHVEENAIRILMLAGPETVSP